MCSQKVSSILLFFIYFGATYFGKCNLQAMMLARFSITFGVFLGGRGGLVGWDSKEVDNSVVIQNPYEKYS